ncbi:nitrogen permease regulator 2-domain-containing protein [Polychytrium aggregatum]|uniref:nitrogen permease regulator 2-domain-containing protein n=1 Tax=Polychytrium aggregatum TaxID=110093 RepID=UPI0022FED02D|nr:nitrogen permease regulator 2-domain-containing protein [Polychytrium aggregatum]KAI9208930.1 nitrogen permease regulator 2-domain-containing protein [Polychytrium aggregatum]
MNYPIHIPGPQYERNAFFFNLSFVFERDADTSCYELVVRKLARILRSLEQESLLFSTASTRPIMLKIMEQLHEELNEYHESQISIDASNIINIKVFERFPDPPEVYDFQVPLIVTKLESDKYWDITLQAIFPFINGVNSIKRIAQLSNAKSSLVRLAIRHLIYYGCVKMVDIFQFSNIYIVTPQVRRFMQDVSLRERCRAFVSIPGVATPSDELLLQLLCSFTYDTPVSKLMDSKGSTIASIDIRRFVVFAVVHGLLQRIHTYPILVPKFGESSQNNTKSSSNSNNNNNNNSSSSNSNNHAGKSSIGILDQRRPMTPTAGPPTSALFAGAFAKGTEPWRMIMRTMLTGEHHYDEICTRLDMSVVRLEEELKELGKECTIHKIMKAAPIS